jgi:Zn-dependent peptidase ImmA (M78 family)
MVSRQTSFTKPSKQGAAARRIRQMAYNAPDIDLAVQVVAERFLTGIRTPPTDLTALATRLNVTRFVSEDMFISGELRRDRGAFIVAYSSYLSPERQRFTIAHELGHAVFELSGPNPPRRGRELERICDMLATEFLMPTEEFGRRLGSEPTLMQVFELARLFKTSLVTTALRCAEFKQWSAFEVEGQIVKWAYGPIVRKGSIRNVSTYLRNAIETADCSKPGHCKIALGGRYSKAQWVLEWAPFGSPSRSLFLLRNSDKG